MPNCLGKGLGPTGVLQQDAARRLLGGLVGRQLSIIRDSPQGDGHHQYPSSAGGWGQVGVDGRMDRGEGAAVLH